MLSTDTVDSAHCAAIKRLLQCFFFSVGDPRPDCERKMQKQQQGRYGSCANPSLSLSLDSVLWVHHQS